MGQTRNILTVVALGVSVFASSAMAQTETPKIDQRAERQQARINQGVSSGQLNANEAARAQGRQNKLNADIAAAKSDGKVTAGERAHLKHEENRNSRAIARQKHNNR